MGIMNPCAFQHGIKEGGISPRAEWKMYKGNAGIGGRTRHHQIWPPISSTHISDTRSRKARSLCSRAAGPR